MDQSKCKHIIQSNGLALPLLLVNRSFRCLDSMTSDDMECFLSYLVRFTAAKESTHPSELPRWWCSELEFDKDFHRGDVRLPSVENKEMKLRKTIRSCYAAYNALPILTLSEELFLNNDESPLKIAECGHIYFHGKMIIISKSNLDYGDYSVKSYIECGWTRRKFRLPIDKNGGETPGVDEETSCKQDAKLRFLKNFNLMKTGGTLPVPQPSSVWAPKKRKFTFKNITFDMVPLLDKIGLLPKRYTYSSDAIAKKMEETEQYLR